MSAKDLKPFYIEEQVIDSLPGGVGGGPSLGGNFGLTDINVQNEEYLRQNKGGVNLPNVTNILVGSGTEKFIADKNGLGLGGPDWANCPFRVSMAGALTATSVTITGLDADDITETAGKKWAGETGADITGDHEADINGSNIVNGEGWTDDTTANLAQGRLDEIADDEKITPVEKLEAKQLWDIIVVEGNLTTGTIELQADALSVSTTDFDTAYAALDTYLNTTIGVFNNMATTSTVVRADWDTAWKNYYNERTKILNAISAAAALLADWGSITGAEKPDNNATVGAILGTNVSGGGTTDNKINNDGIITNLKAQYIIAPSDFTAGEDLTAGDAVYFKVSDGKIWKADTDADESTYNFLGFARDGYTAEDTDVQIITGGIITKAGWGLTAGTWYYLSGTAGAVSSTPGTRMLEVGVAISTTELLIVLRKPRQKSGNTSLTGTDTETVTIGFRPALVIVYSQVGRLVGYGSGDSANNQCAYSNALDNSAETGVDTSHAWVAEVGQSTSFAGIVDTFTATTFRLNQTKTGIGADITINLIWVAIG